MSQKTGHWYVIQTQPHAETRAQENLCRQGFTTYLPKLIKSRRHARKTEQVSRPLFPRYLFVWIDTAHQGWRAIRSTLGVSNLVGGENGPMAVREGVIETLRHREGSDGHFRFDPPQFMRGADVRLLDGAFGSCMASFESMSDRNRVAVLLELLGRRVRVVLDAESVAAA